MSDQLERYENLLRWQSDARVRRTLSEMIAELKRKAALTAAEIEMRAGRRDGPNASAMDE